MRPTPVGSPQTEPARTVRRLPRLLRRNKLVVGAYVGVIVLALIGEIEAHGFLKISHVDQLLIQAAFIAFVGIGQTFVILSGGIDLSIPWVLNASAVLLTYWAAGSNGRTAWIIPVLLAGGALIGLINGLGVTFLQIPPIIMTLGMATVVEGALLLYMNGGSGTYAPSSVDYLTNHRFGPVPVLSLVWLGLLVITTIVLSLSPFGRRLYATGLNSRVAEFAGVGVRRVTIAVYMISGAAAALAGVTLAGYVGSSYLGLGDPYLFESVVAVAVGGASILGGTGNTLGTTAGALTIAIILALLPVFGLPENANQIVFGVVILAVMIPSSSRLNLRIKSRGPKQPSAMPTEDA